MAVSTESVVATRQLPCRCFVFQVQGFGVLGFRAVRVVFFVYFEV